MVPKIHKRGTRTIGLLYYLYGPGKAEEHVDPHLVASWDHAAPDPGRDPEATYKQLQQLLDQPLALLDENERPKQHVWHLSVRNGPTDRILSDQEWGDVARRMVAAAGIDDPEQGAGCRWVAVRHADDHIHILATLVREDGYRPDLDFDAVRVQAEARRLEQELGLRRLNPGDGTAAKRPTSAERHKATRQGRERTPARNCVRPSDGPWPAPKARRSSSTACEPPAFWCAPASHHPATSSGTRSRCPETSTPKETGLLSRLEVGPGPVPAADPRALVRPPDWQPGR